MLSRVVALTNPVLDRPETLSQPAPTHQRDLSARPAGLCILELFAARRDAAGRQPGSAMGRGLRRGRNTLAPDHRRIGNGHIRGGAIDRALDHRPPGRPARIVRIGEPRVRGVPEAAGRDAAFGHAGPGIARHGRRAAGALRDRARRRGPRLSNGACGRLRVFRMRRHAAQRPQHQTADGEHGEPGEQADDPGGAVDIRVHPAEFMMTFTMAVHSVSPLSRPR